MLRGIIILVVSNVIREKQVDIGGVFKKCSEGVTIRKLLKKFLKAVCLVWLGEQMTEKGEMNQTVSRCLIILLLTLSISILCSPLPPLLSCI